MRCGCCLVAAVLAGRRLVAQAELQAASPVLKPALSSARCNCGASCCSIDRVSGFSTVKCEVIWPLRSTSMRTSIRPRSAGSSRISKLLLPFLTRLRSRPRARSNGTRMGRRGRGQRSGAVALTWTREAVAERRRRPGCWYRPRRSPNFRSWCRGMVVRRRWRRSKPWAKRWRAGLARRVGGAVGGGVLLGGDGGLLRSPCGCVGLIRTLSVEALALVCARRRFGARTFRASPARARQRGSRPSGSVGRFGRRYGRLAPAVACWWSSMRWRSGRS